MKSLVAAIVQFFYRLRHGITLSNKQFEAQVNAVNALADNTAAVSDSQLRERFETLRQPVTNGTSLNDLSVQAFAMIREAAGRTVAMRPYDVQMLAAFAMQEGKCVEMQTGATYSGVCNGTTLEIWGVIQGQVQVNEVALQAIQFVLLPAALGAFSITAKGESMLLRTFVAK